jgi:hypothetical protein
MVHQSPRHADRSRASPLPVRPCDFCQNVDEMPNGHHPEYSARTATTINTAKSQTRWPSSYPSVPAMPPSAKPNAPCPAAHRRPAESLRRWPARPAPGAVPVPRFARRRRGALGLRQTDHVIRPACPRRRPSPPRPVVTVPAMNLRTTNRTIAIFAVAVGATVPPIMLGLSYMHEARSCEAATMRAALYGQEYNAADAAECHGYFRTQRWNP